MQGSKIRLSPSELSLFCNADIILTKNSIIQKTVTLLSYLQEQLTADKNHSTLFSSPKISKGENYLGLPYVVLDYPRVSKGEDLFFIRSMFWWGQFFSSTLQLAGMYKKANVEKLSAAYHELALQQYYVGIQNDPWQHHFEESNYQKIEELSNHDFTTIIRQQPHIKIAARWPLTEWDAAANLLEQSWKTLTGLVA